jgi:pyruvate formate lyase activating enzyme
MVDEANINGRAEGIVTNIQRFSVHDGPGIRDVIFIKGCPMRCLWCSNPETQNSYPEMGLSKERCIGYDECGRCMDVCLPKAFVPAEDGKLDINRELCNDCGECAGICPSKAIRIFGTREKVDEVVRVVEEDGDFYWRSGGGITISGGEPISQVDFVCGLLMECRKRAIHTAIETTAYARWENLERVCRYSDLVFCDIKHMDPDKHQAYTGVTNELVLENIRKIYHTYPEIPLVVRTPVVTGFNDSEENIVATVNFLSDIKSVKEYDLLPYHGFGESKYRQLGRKYSLTAVKPPSEDHIAKLIRIAREIGPINQAS